jgi:hypothetical protein
LAACVNVKDVEVKWLVVGSKDTHEGLSAKMRFVFVSMTYIVQVTGRPETAAFVVDEPSEPEQSEIVVSEAVETVSAKPKLIFCVNVVAISPFTRMLRLCRRFLTAPVMNGRGVNVNVYESVAAASVQAQLDWPIVQEHPVGLLPNTVACDS